MPAERLAVLGDVHANAAALRAVLADVAGAGIERGVLTGDLVMRGEEPEECVAEVRRLGWTCVLGNTDDKVADGRPRDPDHPKAGRPGSRAWTLNRLSDESLEEPTLAALARALSNRPEVGDARAVLAAPWAEIHLLEIEPGALHEEDAGARLARADEKPKPVKVFILAGQSNMEGKAKMSLVDYQATQPATRDLFKHLRKDDAWIERDLPAMDAQNLLAPFHVRRAHSHLAVEASRA